MGTPTPPSIKIAVIQDWLQGVTRKSIAERNKIGEATVSDIIQKARTNIPDLDLMRGLAVALKKHSFDVDSFACLVRLKAVLDRIGLPEEKLETLLEEINVHCYIEGTSEKDFISKIDEVFELASELNTSIWGIDSRINQKKMEVMELDKEIAEKRKDLSKNWKIYGLTVDELENYGLSRLSKEKRITKKLCWFPFRLMTKLRYTWIQICLFFWENSLLNIN